MNIGTKTQFAMLLLLLAIMYVFRIELMVGGLNIYSLTGNAHSKRLLGEYYALQANDASKRAANYFQQALVAYKMQLPGMPADQQKWIEYIIGNQYECGKGVEPDLEQARVWYQKSIENGLLEGKTSLQRLHESFYKTKKKKKKTPNNPENMQ